MIVFSKDVNEQDAVGNDLNEQKQYESYKTEMSRLEDKYTNYGCYCYNSGVDNGIHGGGVPRDPIDRHCKELYQCYKVIIRKIEHFAQIYLKMTKFTDGF
jgi:hypothetical protein